MSWQEVYYEHCKENIRGAYWKEEKVLPYVVCFRRTDGGKSKDNMERFSKFLITEGFQRVNWGDMTTAVLVNLKFKKFAMMEKPATHSCVNSRDYTEAEFISEVFEPWKAEQEIRDDKPLLGG